MRVDIFGLGIGHGDAILFRQTGPDGTWTCLIDGGESPDRLKQALAAEKVEQIDLLILSHLDSDHIGGLKGLVDAVKVGAYWGPVLQAFKRHYWLFGSGCQRAIERGEELEKELSDKGIDILYPLEGFTAEPTPGVRFKLLNPAARLIQALLTQHDASALLDDAASLGWLLGPDAEQTEESLLTDGLSARVARGYLTPADTQPYVESTYRGVTPDQEFFGDAALNNTSLAIYASFSVGNISRSALFPGDLEDWTYVLAKNPMGLKADLLKASHHGGRAYLNTDEPRYHEVMQSVRPRVCLVSANGRHDLPHMEFREAARLAGATVCCTCVRRVETIAGKPADAKSCHTLFDCSDSATVGITFEGGSIRSNRAACVSGWGHDVVPIIQVQQHVIQPSPLVSRLLDNELRTHIGWVKRKLRAVHADRVKTRSSTLFSDPLSLEQLAFYARQERKDPVVTHMQQIVEAGRQRAEFWAPDSRGYRSLEGEVYALPSKEEVKWVIDALNALTFFVMPLRKDRMREHGRRVDAASLTDQIDFLGLGAFIEHHLGYPSEVSLSHIWPFFYAELRKSWSAYAVAEHGGGNPFWGVAFERSRSDFDVRQKSYATLTNKFRVTQQSNKWLYMHEVPLDRAEVIFGSSRDRTQLVLVGSRYGSEEKVW